MIKNYFKIAWRNLVRNKVYSLINIVGLAIGMTACALIGLYVIDENQYDKHHQDGERIYRIASEAKGEKFVAASAPIANGLKRDFPEVEQATRLLRFPPIEKFLLKHEPTQKQFFEINGYYIDSNFFQIFNYDFILGDKTTALNQPNSLIISEQIAIKFFGNDNAIDKVIKVIVPFGESDYVVKGVFKNGNHKSHIPVHLFLSMNNSDVGRWVKNQTNWATNNIFHTYVKLKENTNAEAFESKLAPFLERNGGADLKAAGFSKTLFIQPLKDIYLKSNYGYEVGTNGNITYLYIFTSIALFILLIACINFMNLSTARSEKRAKEVGVRKVIGAAKSNLIGQFLSESVMMSLLALILAVFIIWLSMPIFNQLTGKDLSLYQEPKILFGLFLLTLFTGLVSGLYPALYLASFKPILVLKGKLKNSISAVAIRKGLVVLQFTISIVLMLGAMLIGQQMHYMKQQNLGFNKNQKIILPIQSQEAAINSDALKNEINSNQQVIKSAIASTYPGIENIESMLCYAEGKTNNENVNISTAYVGNDYPETLEIPILEGRSFSNAFTADSNALVLNEIAIQQLGYTLDNAVGKKVYFEFQNKMHIMNIIGVAKNYHFQSLHQEIKPMAMTASPIFMSPKSYLIINVKSQDYAKLIAGFEKSWKRINPNSPFEYTFLDQDFQRNYEKEARIEQLIRYFALIGIFIACLGLFGLATFTAEQRIKEIGIRKVLGASVPNIVQLLSKDFVILVIVSILIASPIAWWVMNKWLQDFAYRINIEWWVFALAGVMSLLIALLTVSFQAVKAAVANPVKSLRTE
jgi:putative ABC transport system permease protein